MYMPYILLSSVDSTIANKRACYRKLIKFTNTFSWSSPCLVSKCGIVLPFFNNVFWAAVLILNFIYLVVFKMQMHEIKKAYFFNLVVCNNLAEKLAFEFKYLSIYTAWSFCFAFCNTTQHLQYSLFMIIGLHYNYIVFIVQNETSQ